MGSIPYLSWKLAKPNKALEHVWHPLNTICLFIWDVTMIGQKIYGAKQSFIIPLNFEYRTTAKLLPLHPNPTFNSTNRLQLGQLVHLDRFVFDSPPVPVAINVRPIVEAILLLEPLCCGSFIERSSNR